MTKLLEDKTVKRFPKPEGVTGITVCNLTGQLPPDEGCDSHFEYFKKEYPPNKKTSLKNMVLIDRATGQPVKTMENNPNAEWQEHLSVQEATGEWICLDCPKIDG